MNKFKILSIFGAIFSSLLMICGIYAFIEFSKTDFTGIKTDNEPKVLNITVNDNVLTGFTGTDFGEILEIPDSYSVKLGDEREYIIWGSSMLRTFIQELKTIYDDTFEHSFIDCFGNKTVCRNDDDLNEFHINTSKIDSRFQLKPYPIKTTYRDYKVIEGTDRKITKVNFVFTNLKHDTKIKTVLIPATIQEIPPSYNIEYNLGLRNVKNYIVDSKNTTFKSVDGCLIEKETGNLLFFPSGKTGDYTLPDQILGFGYNKLFRYSQLDSLCLNNQITTIPKNCFEDAEFKKLIIPENVVNIEQYGLANTNCREIIFKSPIDTLPMDCLGGNTNLVSFIMPDTVKHLSACCFKNCYNLKTIILSKQIQSVDDMVFFGCSFLDNIVFPDTLISLYDTAVVDGYYDNTDRIITFTSTTPPELIVTNQFVEEAYEHLTAIYIPAGTLDAYKTAFADFPIFANLLIETEN